MISSTFHNIAQNLGYSSFKNSSPYTNLKNIGMKIRTSFQIIHSNYQSMRESGNYCWSHLKRIRKPLAFTLKFVGTVEVLDSIITTRTLIIICITLAVINKIPKILNRNAEIMERAFPFNFIDEDTDIASDEENFIDNQTNQLLE